MEPRHRQSTATDWPDLPLENWADTCATLHLWTQVIGKIRLAHAPMINHWWQVPLYVTCRGLTTSPIPYNAQCFQLDFDFIDHRLTIQRAKAKWNQSRFIRELLRISTPRSWVGCKVSGWKPGFGPCRSR